MSIVDNWDIRICQQNEKEESMAFQVSKPKKLNGHGYRKLLKSMGKKAKGSDLSIEKKDQLSQSEVNATEPDEPNKDEKANADNSHPHSQRERLDFLLRRVKAAGHAKSSNSSNHSTATKKKKSKSEMPCGMDKPKLKKESECCDAYTCKSTKPNFVEYWVPVSLSEMQTEQYCGTLFSNAGPLCSYSKLDQSEVLNDILVSILVSTKKCCDHPYLVDGSLSTSLIRDIPKPELLDAEIKLSNKLLLLHKLLLEIRERGLRVLILYRSLGGSELFSTGDLLDEIIDQKFGTDLSVRIGGRQRISASKRRAALKTFNDKENGKFICLMETDSCIPSIKLSSIDTVIFFNSDWNPMNDLKALQKIDLDSQFEHVNVFRLYSSYTLEEKLLILAKEGTPPEDRISDIKQSTCHQLLTWGASYLFKKLDEFHGRNSVVSNDDSVEDIFLELSNLLPNSESSSVWRNEISSIVEVQHIDGIYPRNISLFSEVKKYPLMDNTPLVEKMILKKPHVYWTELLEGRNPRWKYFSSKKRRVKRNVQRFSDLLEEPASKKCRKETRNTFYQIPVNIRRRIRSKLQNPDRKRKFSGGEKYDPVNNKVKHDHLPSSRTTQKNHSHGTNTSSFQTQAAKDSLFEVSIRQTECLVPQQTMCIASPAREDRRAPSAINGAHVSLTHHNSEPPETSHVTLQSVCKSLKVELEGVQKQKTELLKLHEEKKLQTKMACKDEIDQIRRKYDLLLQNAEMALVEETQVLEAKYNKIYINKTLAEAVMERDITENPTLSHVTSNCLIEDMYWLFFQRCGLNTATRTEQVAEILQIPSLPGRSVAEGPNHESPSTWIASRSDQYCRNPYLTLSNPATMSEVSACLAIGQSLDITNPASIAARPNKPLITPSLRIPQTFVGHPVTIMPSSNLSGNAPAGYRVRAPAPHLRQTMFPQPITSPKLTSPDVGVFSPVSLHPMTSNLPTLQATGGANLWALSSIVGLPL
ncbi:hypothetical protein OROMI_012138 [Orobanche minor]